MHYQTIAIVIYARGLLKDPKVSVIRFLLEKEVLSCLFKEDLRRFGACISDSTVRHLSNHLDRQPSVSHCNSQSATHMCSSRTAQ